MINISSELDQTGNKDGSQFIFGHRHLIALICLLSCFNINYNRQVIAVAIVAMVNQTDSSGELYQNYSCPVSIGNSNNSRHKTMGEFDWNSSLQGYIIGSHSLGYLTLQLPAGRLAEIWGVKRTFLFGNTFTALFTFILPFAAWYHPYALIVAQYMRGVVQGLILPATYALMGNWFPRAERGLLSTLVLCGYSLGSIFGGSFTGWLCSEPHLGWPYTFYLCSLFGVLLCIFFVIFCNDSPKLHPGISIMELQHITKGQDTDSDGRKLPFPWEAVLTSVPFYALCVALFGHYWSIIYFLSVHPTYLGTILHLGMKENGILSSVPLFGKVIGGITSSTASTWLLRKNYVGIDKLRKGCNTIGSLGFCISLLGVYFAACHTTINVVLFTMALLFSGIALSGAMIVCVDMSPTFAGTLIGMSSTVATLSHFMLPIIVGELTKEQKIEEWHEVFFITIGVVFVSAVIFHIFGSAEVQSWNYAKDDERSSLKTYGT